MNRETHQGGDAAPSGELAVRLTRDLGDLEGRPRRGASLGWRLANFFRYRWREIPTLAYAFLGRLMGVVVVTSSLRLAVKHADGTITDYGVVSRRVVTTVGVGYIVDAFQNLTEAENMKFHGFGTGVGAEAVGDTALGTELTTQYAVDSTRPTGTTAEGASANIFRTVATLSPDTGGTIAVTEHGVFSAASAGVLLDRSVFSAVNLVAGSDSLQATYELTFTAGS